MRSWVITALIVLLTSVVLLMGDTSVQAQEPNLDRCREYLSPYTPIEWERCIGNEFNKFSKAPPELKEAYLHAPVTGQWPKPQAIELGYDAPIINFPATDFNGQIYMLSPHVPAFDVPTFPTGAPTIDYWWQQTPSELPQLPQLDEYTAWQNYWMSGGTARHNAWTLPQTYAVPGQ